MASDYQNKTRPADYFSDLLVNNPMKLLRKYSLAPTDGPAAGTVNFIGKVEREVRQNGIDVNWSRTGNKRRIAYVKLEKKPRTGGAGAFTFSAADTISVDASLQANAGWVPVYYLPWDAGGGVVRLEIASLAAAAQVRNFAGTMIDNPGIFITATVTGCSCFFEGNPNAPTIYHAGRNAGIGQADPNNAAAEWRALVTRESGAAIPFEVNKTDYLSQVGQRGGTSTQRVVQYEQWLANKNYEKLQVHTVEPWGCVMGFRDVHNNWTFYLQENATVYYYEMIKKNWYSSKRTRSVTVKTVSRPLIVREVYPNAAGGAVIQMPPPKLVFGR